MTGSPKLVWYGLVMSFFTLIVVTATLVTQIQLAYAPHTGGDDFNRGYQAGLAKGERDALSGRPFYDACSGPSNQYCLGYKIAYGIEYRVTKWLRDSPQQ